VTPTSPAVTRVLWAAGTGRHQPTGAGFDVVLLLHVVCAVVGLGTVVVSAVQAARLRSVGTGPVADGLRAYFAPGVNWAGRSLYGVPVFGFILLGMARDAYGLADGWVLWGLILWVAAIFVAEGVLWPAERRVQAALAPDRPDLTRAGGDAVAGAGAGGIAGKVATECRTIVWVATALAVTLVVAGVLMVAQP